MRACQGDPTDLINKKYPQKGQVVSNTTVSQLERGNLILRFDVGCMLAEALDTTPDALWKVVKKEYTKN